MKKFLKVFITVLLVLGVVCGTTYIFFRNLEKENNTTSSICNMLQSDKKIDFNAALALTDSHVNSDGTDNRLNLIVETNNMLDKIVYDLSSYYIKNNTEINDKKLANSFDKLVKSRNLLANMLSEFNIKKDSDFYNRHLGANDLYEQSCVYLNNYANFANILNQVVDVEKVSDVKFTTFEIYSNVVAKTFSDLNKESEIIKINDSYNVNILNDVIEIQFNTNSVVNMNKLFSLEAYLFIEHYSRCNKELFVKDLKHNLEVVTSANQTNNERTATYYFKTIYGI